MEWTIVTVLVVLVGLIASIVKPIVSLNSSITKLTTVVDLLSVDMNKLTAKNTESHSRIWDELGNHEDHLNKHEVRLTVLEKKKEEK